MKVLFLLAYYNPETAASIYLFENTIEALISSGVEVWSVALIKSTDINLKRTNMKVDSIYEDVKCIWKVKEQLVGLFDICYVV